MSKNDAGQSASARGSSRTVDEASGRPTERKTALAALQSQEQKYRAIFDGSVDAMVLWSQELRTVDVNQAFVHMTGMAREQVVGRHWSEREDAQDMPEA